VRVAFSRLDRLAMPQSLDPIAAALRERRLSILEDWAERVQADRSLDEASEWTRKQFYDHFPDTLEDFDRLLRGVPGATPAQARDEREHAHAHARTRWLQGYSLRSVIREWGHFNSAVVVALASLHGRPGIPQQALAEAGHLWSQLVNDQLTANALEFHRLVQAEAETRALELTHLLERLRALARDRARMVGAVTEGLRADLSVVMTSASLMSADASALDQAELHAMSRSGIAALDRSLADMLLLSRLEAGLERRRVEAFDAAHGLTLLASGLQHQVEQAGSRLTWEGPEPFPVEGDERNVRLVAKHLLQAALLSDNPGPMVMEWGDDPRSPPRWLLSIHQHASVAAQSGSPPAAREIARATDSAQQAQGIAPTGFEAGLKDGSIAIAANDGANLLIVKHLCEILDAGLEVEAQDGIVSYRVSFPQNYREPG
jgi:hypothetical protein